MQRVVAFDDDLRVTVPVADVDEYERSEIADSCTQPSSTTSRRRRMREARRRCAYERDYLAAQPYQVSGLQVSGMRYVTIRRSHS